MRAAGWLGENVEKPYPNDYHIPLRLNWHYNNRYRQRNSIDHVAEAACRTSCRILLNSEFLALHASCSISTMYRSAGRQPLAIMAVLALSERAVTRDELTYLLWPDSPQNVGRQRLRRSLSQLRQLVGSLADQLLTGQSGVGSDVIRFNASMCRVDAHEFVRLSGLARTLPDPDGLRAADQAADSMPDRC